MTFGQEPRGELSAVREETDELAYTSALRDDVPAKMRDMELMGLDPTNPADIQTYYAHITGEVPTITTDSDIDTGLTE